MQTAFVDVAHDEPPGEESWDRAPSRRGSLWVVPAFLALTAAQVALLLRFSPRFFWTDDAHTQYSPAMWWLGRQQDGLVPPLFNPDMGGAGNFVADMQYGVLDPLHWLLQAAAAQVENVVLLSGLYGAVCIALLGSGVLAVLLNWRVDPFLALATSLGVSTSGFFLWFGSSWWPLMWAAGWLVWLAAGLQLPRVWGVLVTAVAAAALFNGGYPYFLVVGGVLVLAYVTEIAWFEGWRSLLAPPALSRLIAVGAGVLCAVPTLTSFLQTSSQIVRPQVDELIGNSGAGVASLLDVVLGSPSLLFPLVPSFAAFAYTALFTVCGAALVDWRTLLRAEGGLFICLVAVAGLVATQLPAIVFGFRNPFLFMTVVQIFAPMAVALGLTVAPRLSPVRLRLAAGLVVTQVVVAFFRSPVFYAWHLLAGVLIGLSLAAVVLLVLGTRRVLAGAAVVLLSASGMFVALGISVSVGERAAALSEAAPSPGSAGQPFRNQTTYDVAGETIADFREQALLPGQSVTVYDFEQLSLGPAYATGIFGGNLNLLTGTYTGYGYQAAIRHRALAAHDCRLAWGAACEPEALLQPAPGTDRRWLDLLAQDRIVVSEKAPAEVLSYLRQTWQQVGQRGRWIEFDRIDPEPGRVTLAQDVDVADAEVGLARWNAPMETYLVSTGADRGTLTFRTPYWPGLRADIDGKPVAVSALDGALLQVDVPAGVDGGLLEISYEPIGVRLFIPSYVAAAVALVGALLLTLRRPRRQSTHAVAWAP